MSYTYICHTLTYVMIVKYQVLDDMPLEDMLHDGTVDVVFSVDTKYQF